MGILLVMLLSFVPMLLYALLLWWLDRYEKEPLYLLAFAFLWGAIPAIILSLLLEVLLDIPILAVSNSALTYDLLGSSFSAPLVEEGVKALAVLGLFLFFRREIDSPLDGLIYGGMTGFGFAAVENFFYLLGAYESGGMAGTLSLTFFRAGLFGLNHAMYTGFTGLGLALVLETRRTWLKFLLPPLGLALAIGTHAYHNTFTTFWGHLEGSASFVTALIGDWVTTLFLLFVIIWAKSLERQRIRVFLEGYVVTHHLPPAEIGLLTSPWERQKARLRALFKGDVGRWWRLGRYFQIVSEAAFSRHRAGQGDAKSAAKLAKLEQKLQLVRQTLTP